MNIGAGRLNEHGNSATPVAARFPSPLAPGASIDSPIKLEDSPSPGPTRRRRAPSVTMEDASPSQPVLRRPYFNHRDPVARARYESQLLEELDWVQSGGSLSGSSFAPSLPATPSIPDQSSPTPGGRGNRGAPRGEAPSGRGRFRGVHTRFLSGDSDDGGFGRRVDE